MVYELAVQELVRNGLVSEYGILTDKGREILRLLSDRNDIHSADDFASSVSALFR